MAPTSLPGGRWHFGETVTGWFLDSDRNNALKALAQGSLFALMRAADGPG